MRTKDQCNARSDHERECLNSVGGQADSLQCRARTLAPEQARPTQAPSPKRVCAVAIKNIAANAGRTGARGTFGLRIDVGGWRQPNVSHWRERLRLANATKRRWAPASPAAVGGAVAGVEPRLRFCFTLSECRGADGWNGICRAVMTASLRP